MTCIIASATQVCNATEREMLHEIPAGRMFYYHIQSLRIKGVKIREPRNRNEDEDTLEFFEKINRKNKHESE